MDIQTTIRTDRDVPDNVAAAAQIVSACGLLVDAARRLNISRDQLIDRVGHAVALAWPQEEVK